MRAFIAHRVRFLVVGAYARAAHGVPRASVDFDVWIEPSPRNAAKAYRALADFGAPLHDLKETDLAEPGIIFQIGVAPVRIDVLTKISGLDFAEGWPGRLIVRWGDLDVPVIGLEDYITNKRAAGRPKDIADAIAVEPLLKR